MRRSFAPLVLTAALLIAGCSSDTGDEATPTADATTSTTAALADVANECDQGATLTNLELAPVEGTPSDQDLTSFDGTKIRLHWFPVKGASASEPAPTILMGPGWSLAGDTSTDGAALFGALSINGMWENGYNVLTWDPRGFGASEGVASVNDPALEGRDTQALLDFVAAQPEAQLDGDGDPRAGMVGFSYGGGIQLTLAGIDCRVDAIVPGIAWHSLGTSLYKAETVKTGWSQILTTTVDPERLDPHIVSAAESGLRDGSLSDEDRDWFLSRGPGDELVGAVTVPTLLIGGTVDTLFTLDEAITNYRLLQANEVPVAMVWFCGGHGTCLTETGDTTQVATSSFAWLDRYLKGNESAPELPALDLVDQDGTRWIATELGQELEPLAVEGGGTLSLTDDSVSGGGPLDLDPADPLGGLVANVTPTRAEVALEVQSEPLDDDVLLLGAPTLTLTYSGVLPEGETDGRVFAQLIDDETGLVVGNQITPIALVLDDEEQTVEVPLEVIAHHLDAGATLTLQIVASTTAYATPLFGGELDASVSLSLPVADPAAVTKG